MDRGYVQGQVLIGSACVVSLVAAELLSSDGVWVWVLLAVAALLLVAGVVRYVRSR